MNSFVLICPEKNNSGYLGFIGERFLKNFMSIGEMKDVIIDIVYYNEESLQPSDELQILTLQGEADKICMIMVISEKDIDWVNTLSEQAGGVPVIRFNEKWLIKTITRCPEKMLGDIHFNDRDVYAIACPVKVIPAGHWFVYWSNVYIKIRTYDYEAEVYNMTKKKLETIGIKSEVNAIVFGEVNVNFY